MKRPLQIEAILLFLILTLAFYMALFPRLNYPFPLHVDEWMHITSTLRLLSTGSGLQAGQLSVGHPEAGYYLWFGTLLLSTGLPWLTLSRLVPALVLGMIVFICYAWGRKEGFGLEAAFCATFIHSTIRFLGPAFLVPVTLGLIFFPTVLILLNKIGRDWRPVPLIAVCLMALFLIHGTTAVVLSFILAIFLVFYLSLIHFHKQRTLPALSCLLLIPATALVLYLWNPSLFTFELRRIFTASNMPLPPIIFPLPFMGYTLLVLSILGSAFMLTRGGWRNYAMLASTAVLLFFVQVYRHWFDVGPELLYERGWLYVMLLIALIAGYGIGKLRYIGLLFSKGRKWRLILIYSLLIIIIAVSLFQRMDSYNKEIYYQILDNSTYYDFIFIANNIDDKEADALLDPSTAWSFYPITGKPAYSAVAYPWGMNQIIKIYRFLSDGARDTEWLTEKKIDLIYSPFELENPDLVKLHEFIYILRKEQN